MRNFLKKQAVAAGVSLLLGTSLFAGSVQNGQSVLFVDGKIMELFSMPQAPVQASGVAQNFGKSEIFVKLDTAATGHSTQKCAGSFWYVINVTNPEALLPGLLNSLQTAQVLGQSVRLVVHKVTCYNSAETFPGVLEYFPTASGLIGAVNAQATNFSEAHGVSFLPYR